MNETTHFSLTMICAPAFEEAVIDWLLSRSDCPPFSTSSIFNHQLDTSGYSFKEQVVGKQSRVHFELILPVCAKDSWLADLKNRFADTGLQFHAASVDNFGTL
ncbi:MAG: DUF3240 family protein [Thiotrichales bacterium]